MVSNVKHTLGLTLVLLFGCGWGQCAAAEGVVNRDALTNVVVWAQTNLTAARKLCVAEPTNSVAAWELGRACFAWGKLLKEAAAKEKVYTEGVAACRRSLSLNPKSAPANYYLGMNIGRVADLKRNLAAFSMVKEVERFFQQAAKLDEKFAYGGPDRNLGLLYWHAPGWPISLGSQKLARKHLERAVKVAPDYPENRLNLTEAYMEWKDKKLFQQELAAIQQIWAGAKTNLTGLEWEADWVDWENRRTELLKASKSK